MKKISSAYITVRELLDLVPVSSSEARSIIRSVNRDLEAKGCYIPKTKCLMAPTKLVLKKINLNPRDYMQ